MKIFKSIVVAFFISFSFFFVYLVLNITFPELFIKDQCKLILGFAYFVFPSISSAINPVILFPFSTNFRHALPRLCTFSFRKFYSCCREENSSLGETAGSQVEVTAFKQTAC